MRLTSSNAPEPKYPEYYILDIDDLVTELCDQWHTTISNEVSQYPDVPQQVYPEVYTVDPSTGQVSKQVHVAQHYAVKQTPWNPDVSYILTHVIEAIKQLKEVQQDLPLIMKMLEYDISCITHYQLAPNIPSDTVGAVYKCQVKLAEHTAQFARKLFQRFLEIGLYKNGYFPYHFAGWQDRCALVQLDQAPFSNSQTPLQEIDPPHHELLNPYGY